MRKYHLKKWVKLFISTPLIFSLLLIVSKPEARLVIVMFGSFSFMLLSVEIFGK